MIRIVLITAIISFSAGRSYEYGTNLKAANDALVSLKKIGAK